MQGLGGWVFGLLAGGTWLLASDWGWSQIKFRTGTGREQFVAEAKLEVNWLNGAWRSQLQSLGTTQRISLFLDRRINPDLLLDLAVSEATVPQVLWLAASQQRQAVCVVDDTYYVGPPEVAARLPMLLTELRDAIETRVSKSSTKKQWLAEKVWELPRYGQPREALQTWLGESLTISGLGDLPHDVWDAQVLAPHPRFAVAGLICASFGKWLEVTADGNLRLIDFPQPQIVSRTWKIPRQLPEKHKMLEQEFPQVRWELAAKTLTATADAETINRIERRLVFDSPVTEVTPGNRRYTLKTQAPRGALLATVAQQLKLTMNAAAGVQSQLDERVTIDVTEVTIEELLDRVVAGTEIGWRIEGERLEVFRK